MQVRQSVPDVRKSVSYSLRAQHLAATSTSGYRTTAATIRPHSTAFQPGDSSKRLALKIADRTKLAIILRIRPLLNQADTPPLMYLYWRWALLIDIWYRRPSIDTTVNAAQKRATTGEGIDGKARLRRYAMMTSTHAFTKYEVICFTREPRMASLLKVFSPIAIDLNRRIAHFTSLAAIKHSSPASRNSAAYAHEGLRKPLDQFSFILNLNSLYFDNLPVGRNRVINIVSVYKHLDCILRNDRG